MSDQPVSGGVPRALRMVAESAGLDVTAELYNESLRYAAEGHLRMARERLAVLLALSPEDGDSRLLLAKVEVAGQRWQAALAALDEAASCGVDVPKELRRAVEDHLRAEVASDEEHRSAVVAREQGEIKALRQEARRLRSENAQYLGRVHELEGEARKWAWTTAGVSTLAILFIAANLIFGGSSGDEVAAAPEALADEAPVVLAAAAHEPLVDEELALVEPVPPPVFTVAEKALIALSEAPGLEGASLGVTVTSGSATLDGQVSTHAQRKAAEQLLVQIEGIDTVDTEAVSILARTEGATHTVGNGDTLGGIAWRYYGDSIHHDEIVAANKGLRSKSLQIGQSLVIPPID